MTMKSRLKLLLISVALTASFSCSEKSTDVETTKNKEVTAKIILGNPAYQAICFGGYRERSRDIQPTVNQLKEDVKILSAMGIKILRTYNVQLPHATTLLKAIRELKKRRSEF